MALVVADRVKETTTSTGTGAISLGGAEPNFRTFSSVLSDADTTYYAIIDDNNLAFEVGLGTYASSGNTITRTTVLASSNSNNAVNFSAGTKDVFLTYPADKSVNRDASGNVSVSGGVTATSFTGPITATQVDLTGQGDLRLQDASGGQYVALQAPATVGSSFTFTLPSADGSADQLLKTDGSGNLSFTTINASPSITATADGAIANGDPCIITSAGKAKKVTGSTYLKGADNTYTSNDPGKNIGIAYNPDQDQFVAFSNVGATARTYAVVVDPSANTVSFGASDNIDTSVYMTSQCIVYDTSQDCFVLAYRGGSDYGKAVLLGYDGSGSGYSPGSATTYQSSAADENRLVYDSNAQRTVVFYKTATGNGNLNACVLQANSSTYAITAGTAVAADSSGSVGKVYGATFDSSNNKVVAIYEKSARLYSVVGTVDNSDNSISFATAVELPAINSEGNYDPYSASIGYDVSASRLVALTAETSNANEFQGTFLTSGSISGTTVSWRPWTSWLTGADASGDYYTITEPTFVYNSTTNTNVLIGERTTGSQITMQEFKLDSNGDPYFTLGPKVIIEGSNQDRQRMAYSTTDELMVLGRANGSATTYCVVKDRSGALTEGEFAGISDAAYSDGATATLQITGSVDDSQTGLEVGRLHVLQGDGTIVPKHNAGDYVTAASNKEPNVDIGVAKSATEILIE